MMITGLFDPVFNLPLPPIGTVRAGVCRKKTWDMLPAICHGFHADKTAECVADIVPDINVRLLTNTNGIIFLKKYIEKMDEYFNSNMDIFNIPESNDAGREGEAIKLPILTYPEHMVHDYAGYSFDEIDKMPITKYRVILADAAKLLILSRPDGKGRERLNECYNYMHKISNMFE